ncbi:MAG: IS4 family transposase [Gammaproteobacteria bacterium]
MTREAKAAAERLPGRISLGVLARTFTAELLDEVIEAAGAREKRRRLLPARLTLQFCLACWLFMACGYGLVLSKLADAHAGRGWGDWKIAGTGSITRARARLGVAPLKLLFSRVAGPLGTPDTPGTFFRGLRVVTIDGFTLDVPDTKENAAFFGRGGNGSDTANPYPQLRALALAEAGTRSLLGVAHGPHSSAEQTLAETLLVHLRAGLLVLCDRGFGSWKLWSAAAATGADLLWRLSASFTLPVIEVLPDGTYISELRPPRKKDGAPVRVRVIEYTVTTTDAEGGKQTSECFTLTTTLLDVHAYPATELAALYHDRWQAETGIADMKTALRGGPAVVLRSQSPEMVEQEFWAFCCVYQAIRDLIAYAAPPGLDPGRISFKRALHAARDSTTRAALSPHRHTNAP